MDFYGLFILMVVVWGFGQLFRRLRWPVVFGELIGGILVGPMVLSIVHTGPAIEILAEFGIFFLMLHSGLETRPDDLFKASKASFLVALGGVLLPFLGGYLVSRGFGFPLQTALFVGMGLAVTSIAVSARLFKDLGIQNTDVAHLTMGAAIVDDILALILLSAVLDIAQIGSVDLWALSVLIFKIIAFFALVLWLGKHYSHKLDRVLKPGKRSFMFALIIALLFGLVAELIGLHIIIGAFLAGLFIREEILEPRVFQKIEDRVYGLAYDFLGPIFFAALAFHLDFSAVFTNPLYVGAIVVVAILGKVIGAGGMGRLLGFDGPRALLLGLSMNNRGAVELIIASVGLTLGIIDQEIFSVLIIMAFVTTVFSMMTMKSLSKRILG